MYDAYICIHIHMYTYTYVYTCIVYVYHILQHASAHMYNMYTYVRICICIHMYGDILQHAHAHMCMYTYVRIFMMRTISYVYICMVTYCTTHSIINSIVVQCPSGLKTTKQKTEGHCKSDNAENDEAQEGRFLQCPSGSCFLCFVVFCIATRALASLFSEMPFGFLRYRFVQCTSAFCCVVFKPEEHCTTKRKAQGHCR